MKTRREFLAATGGLALIPLISSKVIAAEKVPLDDPAAKALKYVEDATDAVRTDKMGFKGEGQICSNCRFYAKTDEVWGGCALFQNKLVKGEGWCSGWIPLAN